MVSMTREHLDLRARMARGVAWKITSQAIAQGSRLVVGLLLARLLAPADFGLAALALTVVTGLQVLGDIGLGAALIQRPHLTEAERSTAFWCTLVLSVLLAGVMVAIAGPVAAFFHQPGLAPMLMALSSVVALNALSAVQKALLTRDLKFRSLESRQIAATLCGAVVALALAFSGAGAWAIAGQWITQAVVAAVLLWILCRWRPHLTVDRAALRSLGGFGLNVTGTQILFFLNRSTDNVLIGRGLGSAALGAYNIAYQLMLFPLTQVAGIVADVLYPALSRLQGDIAALRHTWLRTTRLVASVCAPVMLGLVAVAPDLVPVLLGEKWSAAIPVMQVLAPVGLLQSLQRFNSGVLQARDRTGALLRFSILSYALACVGFVAGLSFGITGVAVGYALATLAAAPIYLVITTRAAQGTVPEALRAIAGPVGAGAAAGVAAAVCGPACQAAGLDGHLPRLVLGVLAGALVYLPALRLLAPDVVADALAAARSLRDRRRPRAAAPAADPAAALTTS